MTKRTTSVAMTSATEEELASLLVRDDGQEDICLATYRPSTGLTRDSALIAEAVPPEPGDRYVHGNATVTAEYILRGAAIAQRKHCGLVFLHSHPEASKWQFMSEPDRDTESSYANLAREMTGLPLVGMTLATGTKTWSARHWNIGTGRQVDCTHSSNVPGRRRSVYKFRGTTSYFRSRSRMKGNCARLASGGSGAKPI